MQSFRDYVMSTMSKNEQTSMISSIPQYPTGFIYLDYMTGSYLNVYDTDECPLYTYHNIGISAGSVVTIIAKSQGGKTTLAIKVAVNMLEAYITDWLYRYTTASARRSIGMKNSEFKNMLINLGCPMVHIADTEHTLPTDYVKKVAQYSNKLTSEHVAIDWVTTDKDLIRVLEKHIKFKISTMKKVLMPTLDMFGKPIYEYPPTALIVDSASQLLMEDCDDLTSTKKGASLVDIYASATQNTAGAKRAKNITAMYSQLVNYAKKFNIVIFSINHINKLLPVNGIPVKQYRGLNASETIGGGERAIYLSANILRLDVIKSIGTGTSTSLDLGEGVSGFIAKAKWIKSKGNSLNHACQLVYTNKAGYDPLLSNIYYGIETKDIQQIGRKFAIDGYEDIKFTLKDYEEVFADHPELFGALYDSLRDKCAKLLDNPDNAEKNNLKMLEQIRKDSQEEFGNESDAQDIDDIFAQMINAA